MKISELLIIIGAMLQAMAASQQQPAASPQQAAEQDETFHLTADANLVLLQVGVQDASGHYVSNLTRENFHVFDESKPQVISQFGHADTPVTVGLVIDNSGSMRPKRVDVINAALAFLNASNPKDEVFVTHFNDRVREGLPANVPFSDDPNILKTSLFRNGAEGRTALYDGILSALHHLELGTQDRKSLLLVSDGGDNASTATFNQVLDAVRETQAVIYTIGIFDQDDPDRNPGLLKRLASVSGGECFLPADLAELNHLCQNIARDIRNRYTLGYVPQDLRSKKTVRTIRVTANYPGGKNLIVHARTSYRIPEQMEVKKNPPRK